MRDDRIQEKTSPLQEMRNLPFLPRGAVVPFGVFLAFVMFMLAVLCYETVQNMRANSRERELLQKLKAYEAQALQLTTGEASLAGEITFQIGEDGTLRLKR